MADPAAINGRLQRQRDLSPATISGPTYIVKP